MTPDADRKKVFVAISGGVDSSTSAALLLEAGYDCQGLFMITSDHADAALTDAKNVAAKLDIKLHVLDLRSDFEDVLKYFCSQYAAGLTPNPCVYCNRFIKFGKLWQFARVNGADFFATGHYARIFVTAAGAAIFESADTAKDQSYVLAMIDRNILPNLLLPMGGLSKSRTRQLAAGFNLGTEHKPESQEICFVRGRWTDLLESRCPQIVRPGNIVDSSGKILGRHNGIHRFTIGQRRGLRVAMGKPWYVTGIDAAANTVVLGPEEQVLHKTLTACGVNWLIDPPASSFRAKVKIRYNHSGAPATVCPRGNSVTVKFDQPVWAITPGQLAVFYISQPQGFQVAGGAWIDTFSD